MRTKLIVLIITLFFCSDVSVAQLMSPDFNESFLKISQELNPQIKLKLVEEMLQKCDEDQKYAVLPQAAKTAFAAGEKDKALIYAQNLLDLAQRNHSHWNYGNAIHDGHMVYGRIALANDDLKSAISHLLEAGKTPGSPQLNVFGPNMSLAKDLLEKGEKKTVIEYLEMCKKFWEEENGRLDSWISSIKGGGMPYFEANLLY